MSFWFDEKTASWVIRVINRIFTVFEQAVCQRRTGEELALRFSNMLEAIELSRDTETVSLNDERDRLLKCLGLSEKIAPIRKDLLINKAAQDVRRGRQWELCYKPMFNNNL
jgi:hypothetical protein